MKKSKNSAIKWIILVLIVLIISAAVIFYVLLRDLNAGFDEVIFERNNTSISKIYYFDYESRQDRIGVAKEIKDEEIFLERSEWIDIYDIPENLKNAFIAVEDKRFYEHSGVDWLRTIKATLNHVFRFDKSGYGGSTITQQLIKNVTGENDFTVKRKIEEIYRALRIEKKLSKNEILENYLNVVYMSENCYGVSSASKLYFEKNVDELTLTECAALAAIVQNPSKYDPYKNPQNNEARRKTVLGQMLSQGMISEKEYEASINERIWISDTVEDNRNSGIYSWYTEALLDEVSSDLARKYDISKGVARNLILKGGYNIYSVIDPEIQKTAEKVFENYKAYVDNQDGLYPQSSCVVLDPYTSDVLAIVGGVGKKDGNLVYNRATKAKRPLASVIKPLSVYAPGLESGAIDYSTVFDDTPLELRDGVWWPKNSPNRYRGLIPVYYAVAHSVNTVAVKALQRVGMSKSHEYLTRFGISIDSARDFNEASLGLGQLTYGETLLNVTNAYNAFANGGIVSNPKTYLYVTNGNGKKILEKEERKRRAISPENAYIMTMMLNKVVEEGTASSIKVKAKIETAGKTGTSSNSEDKWFIGYTPYYTCGVWTGFDTPRRMNVIKNPSCALFDAIMCAIHKKDNGFVRFIKPENVVEAEFCADSGMITGEACKRDERGDRILTGYFVKGKEPNVMCDMHKNVYVNSQGKIINSLFGLFGRRTSLLSHDRHDFGDLQIEDDGYLIKNRIDKS